MWGSSTPSAAALAAQAERLKIQEEAQQFSKPRFDPRVYLVDGEETATHDTISSDERAVIDNLRDGGERAIEHAKKQSLAAAKTAEASGVDRPTAPPRPPASKIEAILWRTHQTLIPESILDDYYARQGRCRYDINFGTWQQHTMARSNDPTTCPQNFAAFVAFVRRPTCKLRIRDRD